MQKGEPLIDDERVMWAARAMERAMGALSKDPDDAVALGLRAPACHVFGLRTGILRLHEQALEDYDAMLRHDPNDGLAHAGRGRALACLGRVDDALESFDMAQGLAPSAPLCLEHGRCLFAFGDYAMAAATFNRARSLAPDDPVAHAWAGEAMPRLLPVMTPIDCFVRAAELAPRSASAHNRLAVALLKEKRHADASRSFVTAISIDPGDATLQSGHDDSYWFGHDVPGLAGGHASGRGSMGAQGSAGRVRGFLMHGRASGIGPGTVGRLRQALALDPNDHDASLGLGLAYLEANNVHDALEAFGWAVEANGGSLEAHFNRCRALSLLGRHEEALRALETAAGLSPADAGFHLRKANALCRVGHYAGAISACRSATALGPTNPEAHKTMAALCTSLGIYGDALASIDRAIRLVPDDAVSYVHRGYVLESAGRMSGSLGAFHRAIQINSGLWSLTPRP